MKPYSHIMAARAAWPMPLRILTDAELEEGAKRLKPQLVIPETPASDVAFYLRTCGAFCKLTDREYWLASEGGLLLGISLPTIPSTSSEASSSSRV